MTKRDPYRVLVKHSDGTQRMMPAKSRVAAAAIAAHWRSEHSQDAKIFRWNADDQRYLAIKEG